MVKSFNQTNKVKVKSLLSRSTWCSAGTRAPAACTSLQSTGKGTGSLSKQAQNTKYNVKQYVTIERITLSKIDLKREVYYYTIYKTVGLTLFIQAREYGIYTNGSATSNIYTK